MNGTRLRDTWPLRWRDVAYLLIAYVVITGVSVAIGELLVHSNPVGTADVSVSRWFERQRRPWLNSVATVGAGVGDTATKIAVTLLAALVMLWVWRRWREPLIVSLALVLEALSFITITFIVSRPRPPVVHLQDSPVNSSFPSGHTAAATAYTAIVLVCVWRIALPWLRTALWALVAVVIVYVGVSRLYQGMHFLTDVIYGVALGVVSVAVTVWIVCHADREGPALDRRDEEAPPAAPVGAPRAHA